MNWRQIWAKYPKWMVAFAIFMGSTLLFAMWWLGKKQTESRLANQHEETQRAAEDAQAIEEVEIVPGGETVSDGDNLKTLSLENAFLNGERIYHLVDGDLKMVDGIEFDFGGDLDRNAMIVFFEDKFMVSRQFRYWSYHKNGRMIGRLQLPGGDEFFGYVTDTLKEAIYVKEGDIWRAEIDWAGPTLIDERPVTRVGYFPNRSFSSGLVAATSEALLFRDLQTGMIWVDLRSGEIESGSLPVDRSTSPDGRLVVGDVPTRPAKLIVFDVDTKSFQEWTLPMRVNSGGVVWLDQGRSLYAIGPEIYRYDHATSTFEGLFRNDDVTRGIDLLGSSYGHQYTIIRRSQFGLTAIEIDSGKVEDLPEFPITGMEWLSEDAVLLVSDVPDTAYRGSWFYRIGSGQEAERILEQPLYPRSRQSEQYPRHYFPNQKMNLLKTSSSWIWIDTETGWVRPTTADILDLKPILMP